MKLLLLLICSLTLIWRSAEGTDDIEEHEHDANALKVILSRLNQLEAQNKQQANEIQALRREDKRHQQEIGRQARTIERQAQKIDELSNSDKQKTETETSQQQLMQTMQDKINNFEDAIESLKPTSRERAWHELSRNLEPDTQSQFTAFTCTDANITINCPTNRMILVTTGNYGQHGIECSSSCCPPNPQYDCGEVIEENSPQDWLAIQALCDGQQTCQFPNLGTTISDCEEGYTSDYMQLFYNCLPDDETGPVAFTAWTETGDPTEYAPGAIVMFEQVLTNIGGHYNPATSSFICPFDGIYLLSVSVMSPKDNSFVVELVRSSTPLARALGDDVNSAYSYASTTVATECSRSEILWVRAGYMGSIYGAAKYSVFTGHLIHRL